MGRGKLREKPELRRSRRTRRERSRLLIVTEGEQTEVQYFKQLKGYLRATGVDVVGIDVKGAGQDPVRVVNRAFQESKRGGPAGADGGFDAVWCVLDVDEHRGMLEAINEARKRGFHTAISNPCFEIWRLWHYEDCERYVRSGDLRKLLKKHGMNGKDMPAAFDFSKASDARARAVKMSSDGEVPGNPGSSVWMLSDQLQRGRTN